MVRTESGRGVGGEGDSACPYPHPAGTSLGSKEESKPMSWGFHPNNGRAGRWFHRLVVVIIIIVVVIVVVIIVIVIILCIDLALQHIFQPVLQLVCRRQVLLVIHLHPDAIGLQHAGWGQGWAGLGGCVLNRVVLVGGGHVLWYGWMGAYFGSG